MRRFAPIALLITLAVAACGATAAQQPAAQSTPSSAPTVTVTPAAVPQACLDALDKAEAALGHARTGLGYMADLMGVNADGWTAAASFDTDGLETAVTKMNKINRKVSDLTPQVGAAMSEYQTAAAQCRAASR